MIASALDSEGVCFLLRFAIAAEQVFSQKFNFRESSWMGQLEMRVRGGGRACDGGVS